MIAKKVCFVRGGGFGAFLRSGPEDDSAGNA